MNILELVDIDIPTTSDKVEFYTVDPGTFSFVKFGTDLLGTNNTGKVVSMYVITTEDIANLSIGVQTSSNIIAKVKEGSGILSDFSVMSNNNNINLLNVTQNTPIRITLFFSVLKNEWEDGEIEMVWSYP